MVDTLKQFFDIEAYQVYHFWILEGAFHPLMSSRFYALSVPSTSPKNRSNKTGTPAGAQIDASSIKSYWIRPSPPWIISGQNPDSGELPISQLGWKTKLWRPVNGNGKPLHAFPSCQRSRRYTRPSKKTTFPGMCKFYKYIILL